MPFSQLRIIIIQTPENEKTNENYYQLQEGVGGKSDDFIWDVIINNKILHSFKYITPLTYSHNCDIIPQKEKTMLYALVLTLFLGFPGNTHPVEVEILFKTEKECKEAVANGSFSTELPIVQAQVVCEARKTT